MPQTQQTKFDAPSLVAIAIAAHRTADRDLERAARRELKETHGVELRFTRGKAQTDYAANGGGRK